MKSDGIKNYLGIKVIKRFFLSDFSDNNPIKH